MQQRPKMLVVDEEPSDPSHGWAPASRPVEVLLQYGFVPLDKPRGPTSHEVVAWVRKLLSVEKAGHSGTLDPPVSGVLPIGLGHATKALSLLLLFPKEYRGVMRLHSAVPRRQLDEVLAEFSGEIFQRPPQRSSVSRETRTRTVYELEITEAAGNLYLFRCLCQSGTYIRKLVYDMGEVLGVGATMVELRRTMVGPVAESAGLTTLHQLNDAVHLWKSGEEGPLRKAVLPIEESLGPRGRVVVRDSAVDAVCHGASLGLPGVLSVTDDTSKGDLVAIVSQKGELVAVGRALMPADEMVKLRRGLACNAETVVMQRGTYPKGWKKRAESHGLRAEGPAGAPRRQ